MRALFDGRLLSMIVAMSCAYIAARPSVASAQRVVILPLSGDGELLARHGEEAEAMMRTVLESASLEPMSASEARTAMTRAGATYCEQPSCAPAMLRTLGATMGAGVAIWAHATGMQVAVVLVDPEGRQANGAREVPLDAAVREAAVEATDAALASWAVRSGAAVRVIGSPPGASITVDRVLWGTIPHEGTLSPGEHRFVVSADGHETERRAVPIQVRVDGEAEEVRFDLALAEEQPERASSSDGGDGLVLGLAIGVPTMAAGLALVVAGAVMEAEGTQCASLSCDPSLPPEERFVSRPATDENVALMITGGVLVIAGGVVMGVLAASDSTAARQARRWTDGTRIFF